jgi:peroxiredoxin Q/BCP
MGKRFGWPILKGRRSCSISIQRHDPGVHGGSLRFSGRFGAIKKKGAVVLGVSKDGAVSHKKFIEKYELPFSLLADESGEIVKAYGAWGEKSMYGKKYMGILRITLRDRCRWPGGGRFPKVKPATHAEEVLAVALTKGNFLSKIYPCRTTISHWKRPMRCSRNTGFNERSAGIETSGGR